MPKSRQVHDALLKACLNAAHAAGKVTLKYFRKKISIREKVGLGLVTNADVEAEAVALKILKKAQPDFRFLTEETNSKLSEGAHGSGIWIVDPLDGTTNFVHGFPMYCVTVAAYLEGRVVAGVIYHPILKETYWAVKGAGAYLNGKRIHVSNTRKISSSLLSTGFAYSGRDSLHHEMTSFEKISAQARAVRRPGSAALDLAYTASGVFDGFWERHLSPWDVAAGGLLVEEAGGKVTDFSGGKFDPFGQEILATNRKIHGDLLGLL